MAPKFITLRAQSTKKSHRSSTPHSRSRPCSSLRDELHPPGGRNRERTANGYSTRGYLVCVRPAFILRLQNRRQGLLAAARFGREVPASSITVLPTLPSARRGRQATAEHGAAGERLRSVAVLMLTASRNYNSVRGLRAVHSLTQLKRFERVWNFCGGWALRRAQKVRKPRKTKGKIGGEWGIRTPEGLHPTRFPSVRHRPLGEFSWRRALRLVSGTAADHRESYRYHAGCLGPGWSPPHRTATVPPVLLALKILAAFSSQWGIRLPTARPPRCCATRRNRRVWAHPRACTQHAFQACAIGH